MRSIKSITLFLTIGLFFILTCDNTVSNNNSQIKKKDSRLIGTWYWKGRPDFSKMVLTDSSYWQIIDGQVFSGDWETRNDSFIADYGAEEIAKYKIVSINEWWQSHPFFNWIPYIRDSLPANVVDTSNFNTDNIDFFIGEYIMLGSLSFMIFPNRSDTIFLSSFYAEMIIDSSRTLKKTMIISGTTESASYRIANIEGDSLITCFNGNQYFDYSTQKKGDTLSLFGLFNTGVANMVEVTYWLKNIETKHISYTALISPRK